MTFQIGHRYRTTATWSSKYAAGQVLRGKLIRILAQETFPGDPQRTHTLQLDRPATVLPGTEYLTFDPDDLESEFPPVDLSDYHVTMPLTQLGGVHRYCDDGEEPDPWRWYCLLLDNDTGRDCGAHGRTDTDGEAADALTAHIRQDHKGLPE